jgi:hypothetical protein
MSNVVGNLKYSFHVLQFESKHAGQSFPTPTVTCMALGSIQPLIAMSTRNISWGVKAAGV